MKAVLSFGLVSQILWDVLFQGGFTICQIISGPGSAFWSRSRGHQAKVHPEVGAVIGTGTGSGTGQGTGQGTGTCAGMFFYFSGYLWSDAEVVVCMVDQ